MSLCWVSKCWASSCCLPLCFVSQCRASLCWVSWQTFVIQMFVYLLVPPQLVEFWKSSAVSKLFQLDGSQTREGATTTNPFYGPNRTECSRRLCRKTTVLSCHGCLINIGFEKNEQHLNVDYNFDHQMYLS